jgi:hypothetical protein
LSAFEFKNERYYVDKYCEGSKEVKLSDGTRCDCVTKTHAIEFEFAPKWAEAIGQAIHYARMLSAVPGHENIKPGVTIICETLRDAAHVQKIRDNSNFYGLEITVWAINCGLF